MNINYRRNRKVKNYKNSSLKRENMIVFHTTTGDCYSNLRTTTFCQYDTIE